VTVEILGVPAGAAAAVWPRVEALVAAAVDEGPRDREPEDYLAACQAEDMQLYLITMNAQVVGIAVTEFHTYPRRVLVHVELVAGERMADWLGPLDEHLTGWVKANGGGAITAAGRKGWPRALRHLGYLPTMIPVRKDIAA
jgi:hypothetical protein